MRFTREIAEIEVDGTTYHSAGSALLFADMGQIVLRDGKRFSMITLLAVVIILLISFRRVRAVFISMIPLLGGMVWMLGIMALADWKINFVNIVVFPVVFGYGVSFGVYIYKRYRESGSVFLSVKRTASALAGSSLTTLVGWASLLVSGHNGLKSMGILAFLGIAAAMIISFTVLPAMLEIGGGKFEPVVEDDEPGDGAEV